MATESQMTPPSCGPTALPLAPSNLDDFRTCFAAESQATLVNPISVSLPFTSTVPLNTTILYGNLPMFRIFSDENIQRTQVVEQRCGQTVAVIEWNNIFSDTVSFPSRNGGKKVKISKWLQTQQPSNGSRVIAMNAAIGRCYWKSDKTFRLALYMSDDPEFSTPFAYLQQASQSSGLRTPMTLNIQTSQLSLNERGLLALDDPWTLEVLYDIITAALILEHRAQMQEKRYLLADGIMQHRRLGVLGGLGAKS